MEPSKLELVIKNFVEIYLEDYTLSDNYAGVAVDVYNSQYGIMCHITILFKKPFSKDESDNLHSWGRELVRTVNKTFNFSGRVTSGHSTVEHYERTRGWYDEHKDFKN